MSDANRNQLWARVLLEELVRSGVRHVVVAPGSRSTPLVLAAHTIEELHVHVCLDERSAAYFALGIGRASGMPAAVVTTSGTAVANLVPAAVEADRAEVPLLLVTADRPRELRDADANQSVRQPGLFATCARAEWDLMHPEVSDAAVGHLRAVACRAVAAARRPGAGPVHLNVPLRKPLEPTEVEADQAAARALDPSVLVGRPADRSGRRPPWTGIGRRAGVSEQDALDIVRLLRDAARPLLVVGHLDLSSAPRSGPGRLLEPFGDSGIPILVDPLSGLRHSAQSDGLRITAYDTLLRDADVAERLRPDLIVQVGRTPTSAVLTGWMASSGADRIVLAGGPLYKDHSATASVVVDLDPYGFARALSGSDEFDPAAFEVDGAWTDAWRRADAAAVGALDLSALESAELAVARTVVGRTPETHPLFVSSSMPIRDVDTASGASDRSVRMFGNRGASGIDGIVSSAIGVARGLAWRATVGTEPGDWLPGRAYGVCLLGDLAFLHDANGLSLAHDADVVFVVVNNDGGGIFGMLPVAAFDPPFTELFATPHGRDLAAHSAAFGVPHEVVEVGELGAAMDRAVEAGGSRVIEVRTDRVREVAARAADRDRAIAAARDALGL
jgi:2-succinyl-5-enolpyruvyl-6-hydroxy-3-cyclohexene-1-carboxylate synthase